MSFVTRTGFRTIQLVQIPYSQQDIQTRGFIPGYQWHFNQEEVIIGSLGA